jgi:transposase-like protein
MAAMPEHPVLEEDCKRCYHCKAKSPANSFKYYNNKKLEQPRYKCSNCKRFFTLGLHGRPQGRTYTKKRNQDPPEVLDLPRDCPHCGVANNAAFKYWNNKSMWHPRFKCLSCGKQFQMRLLVDGDARRLVHTSFNRRLPTSAGKEVGLAPTLNTVNLNHGTKLSCDEMATVVDPCANTTNYAAQSDEIPRCVDPWASTGDYTPELSAQDIQNLDPMEPSFGDDYANYLNFIEAGFSDEVNEPNSSIANAQPVHFVPETCLHGIHDANAVEVVDMASPEPFMKLMESDSLSDENIEALLKSFIDADSMDAMNEPESVNDINMVSSESNVLVSNKP